MQFKYIVGYKNYINIYNLLFINLKGKNNNMPNKNFIIAALLFVIAIFSITYMVINTQQQPTTINTTPQYSYIQDVKVIDQRIRIMIWTDVDQMMGVYLHTRDHQNICQIKMWNCVKGLNTLQWSPTVKLIPGETYLVSAWATELNRQGMTYSFIWK